MRIKRFGACGFILLKCSILLICLVALFLLAIAVGAIQDVADCADRQVTRMIDAVVNRMTALADNRGE
jgi:hypothetical protein